MRVEITANDDRRAELTVAFAPHEPLRTSEGPGSAARALSVLPGLRGHRCDNGTGATFSDELGDTEFAHLLEHASLEIMALAGAPDTLRGATTWDFARDGAGVFRIRLQHDDAATLKGAVALASEVVRWAAGHTEAPPDVESAVRRIRRARRR
ncbi:MAG: hypothetical protein Q7W16_02295 [Coriobacteriia bacterium]|nr:hypothetical protein [Coriobacteriia bacterium]